MPEIPSMRIIHVLIIFLFLSVALNAQEKRALLIGIGDYPVSYGWNKIHGQNDVSIIRKTLIKQGFQTESITEIIDADATFDNIMTAFQSLLASSDKNDVVYLQFSGHSEIIAGLIRPRNTL